MANIWYGIGISIGIALTGWFVSPMISFVLNKLLSYLYDASKKVPELVADTIPDLKNALREVEEQWMLKKLSPDKSSGVSTLEKLESLVKSLKAALYEAEDIVDLIDYHLMDAKARGEPHDTTWLQWCWRCLYNPIRETSALALERVKQSWLGRWVHIVGERLAALWQCLQMVVRSLGRWMDWSGAHLPIYSARPSSRDLKNFLGAITNWFSEAYVSAKDNRDRANTNAGFTRYEQDVDCTIMGPLCTHLKKNMRRIERLLDEASKRTSFTRRVQETIEHPDQQRINGSGKTPNLTNKDEHVTAYPETKKVTGREVVREQIRIMLHNLSSSENVLGICGIPGSGKTTLAQYVYGSEKGGHFDLVMWIHVSENFSVDAIFKRMFEEASPTKDGACPPFNSLNALLTQLENKLNGKRLLLVLDDIWDNKVLPKLVSPFRFGSIGSKILVTSRDESALLALGRDVSCKILPIPPLDDKDFFELLMHYARVNTDDQGGSRRLHTIGGEIAAQLQKSPLAASVVGSRLMKNHDVNFWISVRHEKLLQKTMGALWWCYQHLDEDVRRCFAFCSIFPRGHHLFRDELVNLWVAEGFIRRTNEGEEMEDVGQRYFRQLVSTSFLQPGVKDCSTSRDYYLVHDQLHELAVEVAGSECFRIENGLRMGGNEGSPTWTGEVSPDVRHLYVQDYDAALVTGKILKLENLRTLIIYTVPGRGSVEYEVLDSIFHRLRKLRVLAIACSHDSSNHIKAPLSVPESIRQLKHLRYLAFRACFFMRVTFPSTPTKLYHLWLLDVGYAETVECFGGDLVNLGHLLRSKQRCFNLGNNGLRISNMGKMKSLQTLAHFHVSKEQGYEIKQLWDLNKLRGKLCVSGLENVTSKVEALEANLPAKERLRELKLKWSTKLVEHVDPNVEAEVLEGLCPPMELEILHISNYRGLRYPKWMLGKQNGDPVYLNKLRFSHCTDQRHPPELNAFIHLQSLELYACNWYALPGNMENLTSLKVLLIERCSKIRSLSTLPQSIEELKISSCDSEFMASCEEKGHLNWQKIEHIPMKNFFSEKYREPQSVGRLCSLGQRFEFHPENRIFRRNPPISSRTGRSVYGSNIFGPSWHDRE